MEIVTYQLSSFEWLTLSGNLLLCYARIYLSLFIYLILIRLFTSYTLGWALFAIKKFFAILKSK